MSERGSFRGGRGRGGRGGQGQQKSGGGGGAQEKPKKENILDLNKYMDKEVQVKFSGGREGMLDWFLLIYPFYFLFLAFYFCLGSYLTSHRHLRTIYANSEDSHRYPQGLRPADEPGPR
jgi:hypothetical protein